MGLDWRVVFVLSGLAGIGGLAALPLSLDLARTDPAIAAGLPQTPLAYYLLGLSMALQNLVLYGLIAIIGLVLARRVSLAPTPVLEALTRGRGLSAEHRRRLAGGLAAGLAVGVAIVALDWLFFIDRLPPVLTADVASLADRLLAGLLFGGINEEIKWRLFLVPFLACLFAAAWRARRVEPSPVVWATAIGLGALGFAAFHLPTLALLTELTPLLVTRTLVLNTLAGIVFGLLFRRYGLETAMAAHMAAHLPLQFATGF
jgi:hypothetical protein